jgi:hypothetical protein
VRDIAVEYTRQPVRQAGFVSDELPAVLDEKLPCPGVLVGRTPGPQFLPMLTNPFESELRIRWGILRAAGRQGFANLRPPPRVAGIAHPRVILQEGIDQAAFRLC